ncbi:MAG: hypothetical protein EPO11_07070 [Gammaproteobacteria bacterium]|nr:MAG: hypothetical protein EPO11_07070 [Gammaproteobacteria bacterium]
MKKVIIVGSKEKRDEFINNLNTQIKDKDKNKFSFDGISFNLNGEQIQVFNVDIHHSLTNMSVCKGANAFVVVSDSFDTTPLDRITSQKPDTYKNAAPLEFITNLFSNKPAITTEKPKTSFMGKLWGSKPTKPEKPDHDAVFNSNYGHGL